LFGYVKAYKPDLRMAEYEIYKAVYCSLCRELGKSYGPFAKFILSYDFTFLALLKIAAQEECPGYKNMRCSFNPLHQCKRVQKDNGALKFSAAAAMILFYYKLKDTIHDTGFLGKTAARMVYPIFLLARNSAKKQFPALEALVASAMDAQTALENDNCASLDQAADPTAKLLEGLFSYGEKDETQKRVLARLGYCMGKWIYLMDAVDDLEDDLKKGNYNPILAYTKIKIKKSENIEQAKQIAVSLLNMSVAEAAASLELLRLERYEDIFRNILYVGLPEGLNVILKKEKKACK